MKFYQRAIESLRRIEDFYSNSPATRYDEGRRILGLVKDMNPILALFLARGNLKKRYGEIYLTEIENFNSLSSEERSLRYRQQLRENRNQKSKSLLESWVRYAEPILTEIIRENPERVIGLEYESYEYPGTLGRDRRSRHKITRIGEPDSDGNRYIYEEVTSSEGNHRIGSTEDFLISSDLLANITPKSNNSQTCIHKGECTISVIPYIGIWMQKSQASKASFERPWLSFPNQTAK